jgi:hypothetical protein
MKPDAITASQPMGNARKTPWIRVSAASPHRGDQPGALARRDDRPDRKGQEQ